MNAALRLLATAGLGLVAVGAHAAPQVSVEEAARIASDYLRENGYASEYYVVSLALQRDSLTRRSVHWYARWSRTIKTGDRVESGLEIAMDRTLTRVVAKSAKERARDENRQSAQDIR